jgi:hypothetical protein
MNKLDELILQLRERSALFRYWLSLELLNKALILKVLLLQTRNALVKLYILALKFRKALRESLILLKDRICDFIFGTHK